MTLWGLDLGGTKIEGAILDPANPGQAVHRLRLPTESPLGYEHILGQIGRVVEQLEAVSGQKRPAKLGLGTPGATEPATGTMKNSNTTCLIGQPLRQDVSATLNLEAVLANDANCFALAEATLGAAQGYPVVMGLILGTGVGGGLVVHGRLLEGLHGIAGEWGHNPICGETTPCYCGRKGCVETVLAGPSLERFYREQGGAEDIRLPEIVRRATTGDPIARATLAGKIRRGHCRDHQCPRSRCHRHRRRGREHRCPLHRGSADGRAAAHVQSRGPHQVSQAGSRRQRGGLWGGHALRLPALKSFGLLPARIRGSFPLSDASIAQR